MRPHNRGRFGLARLRCDESGVAAVEFSLLAPVLVLAGLTAVDLGMALTERMTIDHLLRAGANFAMADPGEDAVTNVLKATAKKNFPTECKTSTTEGATITQGDCISIPDVKRVYACPATPDSEFEDQSKVSGCGGDYYTYYRLEVTKTYAGMILPAIQFNPSIEVQIR